MSPGDTDTTPDRRDLLHITSITISVWIGILIIGYVPFVFVNGFIQFVTIPLAIILAAVWWMYTFVYARIITQFFRETFTDA